MVLSLAAWSAGGCLISPPPLIEDPEPERPNVNMSQVVPPTYQLLTAEHFGPFIEFTIPVRGESAGDRLWAILYVNWGLDGQEFLKKSPFPPMTDSGMGGAGSTERALTFYWVPDKRVEPGCNQLTIFVVHDTYVDFDTDRPKDFNKAAMITWWANIDPATGEERDLIDCPGPGIPDLAFP